MGVDLQWNEVAGAESYDIQLYDRDISDLVDLPSGDIEVGLYGAGAVISGLYEEGSYVFRVRASNEHGPSDWTGYLSMLASGEVAAGRRERPSNVAATGALTISGTAETGNTLTADTSAIQDDNGLSRVQFHYQWGSSDGTTEQDIAGATDTVYDLTVADAGRTVKVRVSFIDRRGYAESLESLATAPVENRANTPASGAPTISGTTEVSRTLTADTSGISGCRRSRRRNLQLPVDCQRRDRGHGPRGSDVLRLYPSGCR